MALSSQQMHDTKVFLRTYADALDCVDQIAQWDFQTNHYKNNMKTLIDGIHNNEVSDLTFRCSWCLM